MTGGGTFDDIDAALADAFGMSEVVALADPRKRRGREKRMCLSADDGRRKRATGRSKQFNCKMRPELHRQLVQVSRASGKSIVVMCEEAFTAYLAAMKGARDA
jgi:predicted HicB family RNase H-like nuclease